MKGTSLGPALPRTRAAYLPSSIPWPMFPERGANTMKRPAEVVDLIALDSQVAIAIADAIGVL